MTDDPTEASQPTATKRLHLVRAYFEACTNGRAEDIASCFTDDAVIYDTNHAPIRGSTAIGAFWTGVRDRWAGAIWVVDAGLEDGDLAAVEWSMHGITDDGSFVFRGSEHYRFEGDLIAELHQYWTFDPDHPGSQLIDYPYS